MNAEYIVVRALECIQMMETMETYRKVCSTIQKKYRFTFRYILKFMKDDDGGVVVYDHK